MSEPRNEHERLAAFMDGRLDARERAELLARLTADDDAFEEFASLAAILHQAEEEGALPIAASGAAAEAGTAPGPDARVPAEGGVPDGVISLEERARARADRPGSGDAPRAAMKRVPALAWVALAAVLAGVALVTGASVRALSLRAGDPVRLAARLEHAPDGLPAGWHSPWSSSRGEAAEPVSRKEKAARAARAGAMLVDLAVAVEARDAAQIRVLATQAAIRFDRNEGRAGPLHTIADSAGSAPERLRPLVAQASKHIAKRLGERDALQLGAWTEAARFAADTRDDAFFRDRQTRRMLDRAARITAPHPPARAAVEQVRTQLARAPRQWSALGEALARLEREIASE